MTALISGIGVGEATAWGRAFVLGPKFVAPAEAKSKLNSDKEQQRLVEAVSQVATDITETANQADETTKDILLALAAMLEDPALIEEARVHLDQGWNAETGVARAMASFT